MVKVVISDTSCLIALSKIEKLNLLQELFNEIIITREVYCEFGRPLPEWIIVTEVNNKLKQFELENRLDRGEASAIALALEIENSTLIIDEAKGRKISQSLNIEIIGTIGIILLAEKKGLISDSIATLRKLIYQGFWIPETLMNKIIEEYKK